MCNLCINAIDWNAFSAIGSWLGAIATFLAAIIALYPFFKKGKLYFTINSNIEHNPILTIINNRPEGMLIESVLFFAGPALFGKYLWGDNFLEDEDDLASDKLDSFIEPYSKKRIVYSSTRIIHDISHSGYKLKRLRKFNVCIVVRTNTGKITINTKIKVERFIETLLELSDTYKHYGLNEFIDSIC